ncbi:MAG: adenylate cyclase [Lentisphaerae bacterium GWF2_45_14]|nr:MAG: adenylate cyclase [Lentisphaerae bacterium GWF2_45_14]
MALEIERKFLVKNDSWKKNADRGKRIVQGYVASEKGTVRVRIVGDMAFLTIKGHSGPNGLSRQEFEYQIPVDDAEKILEELCNKPFIEKTRYRVAAEDSHEWEVDVFAGANNGLVMAEIELGSEDEVFILPDWAGEELSSRPEYRNSSLFRYPYSLWVKNN